MINLLYHIYPDAGKEMLEFNLSHMLYRSSEFDRKVLKVVTEDQDKAKEILKPYFLNRPDFEIHYFDNDPKTCELVGFTELLTDILEQDPKGFTFYGHTKGLKPVQDTYMSKCRKEWVRALYLLNLCRISRVIKILNNKWYSTSGAFKKVGPMSKDGHTVSWHYSGTFYWLSNQDVIQAGNSSDRGIAPYDVRHGTEMYPGLLFSQDRGYCIYDTPRDLNHYELSLSDYGEVL